MSSPAVLDVDALVQPIPGDAPAGAPLADLLRFELDDLRKEADPLDPSTTGRRADWGKVLKLATNALENRSKDYLLAVRLLEAATKKHGLPGLRDGLALLQRLTADCWERIHPTPGEGETFDVREGAFKWINDVSRAARFPQTILEIPLIRSKERAFSYVDSISGETKTEFEEAIPRLEPASLTAAYEDLQAAHENLFALAAVLDEKMGSDVAPDFISVETSTNIGSALAKCIQLVEQSAHRRGVALVPAGAVEAAEAAPEDGPSSSSATTGGGEGVARTRDGLYGQLSRIATALKGLEPHSPVPYLIERCVRLGSLPFPELMRAMVREDAALDELDRLLGMQRTQEG